MRSVSSVRWQISDQITGEAAKQHGMSFRRNRADAAEDVGAGENGEEPQTNQRFGNEAGSWEIGITIPNDIVELWDCLPDLCADSAYEEIAIGWKLAQNERWAVFDPAIRLGERRQYDTKTAKRKAKYF